MDTKLIKSQTSPQSGSLSCQLKNPFRTRPGHPFLDVSAAGFRPSKVKGARLSYFPNRAVPELQRKGISAPETLKSNSRTSFSGPDALSECQTWSRLFPESSARTVLKVKLGFCCRWSRQCVVYFLHDVGQKLVHITHNEIRPLDFVELLVLNYADDS